MLFQMVTYSQVVQACKQATIRLKIDYLARLILIKLDIHKVNYICAVNNCLLNHQ
jgi:hypothetical protein